MKDSEFFPVFTMLCETYNKQPTKSLASAYFMVLEDLTIQEFQTAVKSVLATRKFTNLPMPADILEVVNGNPDDVALIALKELEDAMSIHGAYKSVIFKNKVIMACVKGMGGWQAICQMPSDEWKFQKQEFLKLYRAYHRNGKYPEVDYLVGLSEHKNRIDGYIADADSAKVQLIGYSEGYPRELPALTVKSIVSTPAPAIENKRDIKTLIGNTVKDMNV